ncbi:MAG TPA: hypothetical protein VEU33_19080 [Archangium sp.]|nr:hypothetical protein [Archangium sp.]
MRRILLWAGVALVPVTVWVLVGSRDAWSTREVPAGVEVSGSDAKAPAARMVHEEKGVDLGAMRIGGYSIRTESEGGRCVVSYVIAAQGGRLVLDVLPPCDLVLDHRREPQTFSYGQAEDAVTVAAVAGGPPSEERTLDPVLRTPCGTQVQGILLQHGMFAASPRMFQGSTFCPSVGLDEKMFRMFSQHLVERRSP